MAHVRDRARRADCERCACAPARLARGRASDTQRSEVMQAPEPRREIIVASYNIHLGIGRDGHFQPQRIAAVIQEMNADIVALQEVALGAPGFDMLEYLRQTCQMEGIAGPTLVTKRGDYGNAVLTRF